MSRREAGIVYELVVDSSVGEVREKFGNAGIVARTLRESERAWQRRLSES